MNFPIAWSPPLQPFLVHQGPSHINSYALTLQIQSSIALLLLQEQNKKLQVQYLLGQLSQSGSQTPVSPQAYALPEKLYQPLSLNQVSPKSYQVQGEHQVSPLSMMETQQDKLESPADNFKSQLNHMLNFFMNSYGKESEESKVAMYRAQYSSDKTLLSIFDSLLRKYRSCAKSREDMVRLVLRKAMISLRDSVRGKCGLSAKGASLALCKKYFSSRLQELTDNDIDLEDEDQVMNFLLPYKKNSRNKTANRTFIAEIFASEAFYEDYLQFLEQIDDILEADNKKRSKKLIDFLTDCAKDGDFARIKSFKRLPWLKSWLTSVKDVAFELLNTNKRSENSKKLIKYLN